MNEIALQRGGRCLSTIYSGKNVKLEWECGKGHRWLASPDSVKNANRWCPICGGSNPLTLAEMQSIAEEKGGKCLSNEYINAQTTMLWQCAEGHQWENRGNKIKAGQWCPFCAGKALLDLKDLSLIAHARGGRCLSENYVNSKTPLKWKCSEGHEWNAAANNIKNGAWCPYCAERAPLTFDLLDSIAQKRGGRLVTDIVGNNKQKLQWKCKYNHTWLATPNAITRGTWCPKCSEGLGERVVRYFFEKYFGQPFEKVHPEWLRTESGSLLELDGYNDNLKLAFEHQGQQHEKYLKVFHSSIDDFNEQLKRDEFKKQRCIEKNVVLIEVPEIPAKLPLSDAKIFMASALSEKGYQIDNEKLNDIDLNRAYSSSSTEEFYNRLKDLVEKKNGRIISDSYLGTATKICFECSEGHRWFTKPNLIFSGRWCPECAGNIKYTLDEIQQIANNRGGKCLSTYYKKAGQQLEWECDKGHRWKIALQNVIHANSWCPVCRKNQISESIIAEANSFAKQHGGICLSKEYINARTKLKFQCQNGHVWNVLLGNIRQGTWCPKCKRRHPTTAST